MSSWSLEMARQGGWDLWLLVCGAAAVVLLSYAVVARVWTGGRAGLWPTVVGVGGTLVVVAVPPLHNATVGLVWTFAVLAIVSATFYGNLRDQLTPRRAGVLLGMRLVALAVLVPMLFEPVLRFVAKPVPERPLIFLVDTSGSMGFPDVRNGPTRLQSVWQALRPEVPTIADHFVPSYYTFDSAVRPLRSPDELARATADGKSTDLVNAVSTALGKSTREDAAVVLVTDGIDNVSPNVAEALRSAARPIHTVRVGSEQATPTDVANVSVDDVAVPDDFVVNRDGDVRATIHSVGLAGRVVDVKLSELDAAGKPAGELKTAKLVLQPTPDGQAVTLVYRPAAVGLHRVAVWIDPLPGERSTVDNRQEFQALAVDSRIKVLYVEGSVRLEYKWTRQAFVSDPNVELATYLRKTPTEVEAGGTVDGQPFRTLPGTPEQWKRFDVVILGDVEATHLTPARQQQVEQFVANGGGLLMLGGQSSFAGGGYAGTPVEKALPVFAGDPADTQDKAPFVPQLTADAVTHPILDGLTDWFATADRAATKVLPPLNGNVVVGKPKSGAQVLMTHAGRPGADGGPEVVLAVQRYGKGRSAAFTVDTTYLWFLPLRGLGQESPYNKLWGQMVRWLAGQDVRNRGKGPGLDALLNKSTYPLGDPVRVRALVQDERGDATWYAQVTATLTGGSRPPRRLSLQPVENQQGEYDLSVPSPGNGDYAVEVVATKDGKEIGRQKLAFAVLPPADELTRLAADPKLLADVATETHGYHYDVGQFHDFVDQLVRSDPTFGKQQERVVPLADYPRAALAVVGLDRGWSAKYDLPVQGLLAVGLLVAEWVLRRRWQLT